MLCIDLSSKKMNYLIDKSDCSESYSLNKKQNIKNNNYYKTILSVFYKKQVKQQNLHTHTHIYNIIFIHDMIDCFS